MIDDDDERDRQKTRGPIPVDRDRRYRERDLENGFVPCVRCAERTDPHQATWSPADAGHVCPSCADDAE